MKIYNLKIYNCKLSQIEYYNEIRSSPHIDNWYGCSSTGNLHQVEKA